MHLLETQAPCMHRAMFRCESVQTPEPPERVQCFQSFPAVRSCMFRGDPAVANFSGERHAFRQNVAPRSPLCTMVLLKRTIVVLGAALLLETLLAAVHARLIQEGKIFIVRISVRIGSSLRYDRNCCV